MSEVSLPRITATSRRSKQKRAAGGGRSRSRGVSLPPAVPGGHSRASVRRQSSAGARDVGLAAAGGEDGDERQEGETNGEDGERGRVAGRVDSAYGSDSASPPVDKFRLTESEYFKPKEVRHSLGSIGVSTKF